MTEKNVFKKVWKRHPDGLLCCPSPLVLNNLQGHLILETNDILKEGKTDMMLIPVGLT